MSTSIDGPGVPPIDEESIRALLASLRMPPPLAITPFRANAAYHAIYMLDFPDTAAYSLHPVTTRNDDGTMSLVLRVSGDHVTGIKTLNEVAIMTWVRHHTSIPVPAVVKWDASCNNPLGREFTLLERMRGRSVDQMYNGLPGETKLDLVRQLTDMVLTLSVKDWSHVGGLSMDKDGEFEPAPVLEDTFWMKPDIDRYWGESSGETVETLNPRGPYASHADYCQAYLGCFLHAVSRHPSLTGLLDLSPRLRALRDKLPGLRSLYHTRLVLAHKDLHFGNVTATEDGVITGILDWEFAGVVPANRWDPVKAFLWNGQPTAQSKEEKEQLRPFFEKEVRKLDVEPWWETSEEGEWVWDVIRFTRAMIEVTVKGQQSEKVGEWRLRVENALGKLGV